MNRLVFSGSVLLLAVFNFSSSSCFAQDSKKDAPKEVVKEEKKGEPMVVLVKDLKKGQTKVKISQILANPVLKCVKPDCRVISFDVSIMYDETTGKKEKQYIGPFSAVNEVLPAKVIDILKNYKGTKGRIFIEKIILKGVAGVVKADPIILGIEK